jgi:hypothetical protein
MRLRGRLTTIPDDVAVPNGTEGEVRLAETGALLGTVSTSDGWYEYEQDGNPGPIYIEWDYSGVVKNQHSEVTGPSGPVDIAGLPQVNRAWSNGYIKGVGAELLPSATGSAMSVTIGAGAALVQGILYDQVAAKNVAIAAAHATNPRVDRIVVRVVPAGAGDDIEGRSELVVVQGTPQVGANFSTGVGMPALTQTTALWEEEIARVQVDAAVTVIASDKVSRGAGLIVGPKNLPADSVTATQIATGAVGTAELADGAVTTVKIATDAVTIDKIADNAVGAQHIADNAVQTEHIIDGAVTAAKLAAAGVDVLMPGSEFVATGPISSGTRTLVTLGVGPLTSGVQYAIICYFGLTIRNQVNTGTVVTRVQIHASAIRTHEFQNVGGVPRWCPIMQSYTMTGTGASINVIGSVQYNSGDPSDIRAGWLQVVALPLSILEGD